MTLTTMILLAAGGACVVGLGFYLGPSMREGMREGLAEANVEIAAGRAAKDAADAAVLDSARAAVDALPAAARMGVLLGAPFRELLFHGAIASPKWGGQAAGQDDPVWLDSYALPPEHLDDARSTLRRDWDITDAATLRDRINWLLTEGHRTEIADAFVAADGLAALPSDGQEAGIAALPKDVREAVRAAFAARGKVGTARGDAFDIARAAMLAVNGLALGLLDQEAGADVLTACWAEARGRFTGWDHYAESLMAGADVWMRQAELRFAGFQRGWWRRTLDWMVADPQSPWVRHSWPAST